MKYLILLVFTMGCSSAQELREHQTPARDVKPEALVYPATAVQQDSNIINTSGHHIFVLYNSMHHFLPKSDSTAVLFSTECMVCEPVVPYKGHLLFAKQLELFPEKVVYHRTEFTNLDSIKALQRISSYGNERDKQFTFTKGKGSIKHLGTSCNDADFKEVVLQYPTGSIQIKNVLNAEFFEYDLDRDGLPEQFITGTRNCSQELVILRVQ